MKFGEDVKREVNELKAEIEKIASETLNFMMENGMIHDEELWKCVHVCMNAADVTDMLIEIMEDGENNVTGD